MDRCRETCCRGVTNLGGYESYSETMGGILEVAGIPGFLGNADRVYAEADRETTTWAEFCATWWSEFLDQSVGSDLLFGLATRKRLLLHIWGGRTDHSGRTKFGVALGKMRDRVVDAFHILRDDPDPHSKGQRYHLELRRVRSVAEGLGRPDFSSMHDTTSHVHETGHEAAPNTKAQNSGGRNPPQPSARPRDPWDSLLDEEEHGHS